MNVFDKGLVEVFKCSDVMSRYVMSIEILIPISIIKKYLLTYNGLILLQANITTIYPCYSLWNIYRGAAHNYSVPTDLEGIAAKRT